MTSVSPTSAAAPAVASVEVSIIVLTYRRPKALLAVLRALAPQCGEGCEVLIADDGSPAEDIRALRIGLPRFACPVRHVWHPDVGFTASGARNMAVLASTGQRLLFIDGDCVPNPHFIALHARLARPGELVNGSRVLLSERLTAQVEAGAVDLSRASTAQWLAWRLQGDANKLLHLWPWEGAPGRRVEGFRWKGIRSCNLAVWRQDFVAVNGFDESFSGWGHEDADLLLRLHHHGVVRRNGFMATEVFHLWHRENSREQASKNHQTVVDRQRTGQVRALRGLQETEDAEEAGDVKVTVLN